MIKHYLSKIILGRLAVIGLLCLFVSPLLAQNCGNAQVLSNLPFTANNTTCGNPAYLSGNSSSCDFPDYNQTAQYFYEYTPTKDECFRVEGSSSNGTIQFQVHEGCPITNNNTCKESFFFFTFSEVHTVVLNAGKTYYFVLSTRMGCSAYEFEFSTLSVAGASCASSIPITTNYFEEFGQNTGCKGNNYNENNKCGANTYDGNEVVYEYNSPGNECIIASASELNNLGSIHIYQGCPLNDNSNEITSDNRCSNAKGTPREISVDAVLNNPGTYYILVSGRSNSRDPSPSATYTDISFDFQFSASSNASDPLGLDCSTADVLNSTLPLFKPSISIQCKGDDYTAAQGCNDLMRGADYVMTYTAPQDFCGSVIGKNIRGKGGLTVMSACPDDPSANCMGSVGCRVNCDSIYVDLSFTAGETYYIIASGDGGNFFQVDIEITKSFDTPDGCEACDGPTCNDCRNANFEFGTLQRWKGRRGNSANPGNNPGFNRGYINQLTSGHTIMNAGLDDPVVGSVLKTSPPAPNGGRYTLRLGNQLDNSGGEQISYDVTVTPTNTNFFYYYAIVMEDPFDHSLADQPFFGVEMVDASGNPINCAAYEVRSSNAVGFTQTDPLPGEHNINPATTRLLYKDWTLVAVPLDAYVGQTVTITFTVTDCGEGAHMAYAYIDAFCESVGIIASNVSGSLCSGEDVTLTAPDGFEAYRWNTGATTQSITVSAAGTYTVRVTPFSDGGGNCTVDLEFEVVVAPDPNSNFAFDPGCDDDFVDFSDNSQGGGSGLTIASRMWDFGDGTTSTDSAITHQFPGPGTYTVTLTVTNNNGCTATTSQNITIDPFSPLANINAKDTIKACLNTQIQFTSDFAANQNYDWSGPNGFSQSGNNVFFTPTSLNDSGYYYVNVTSSSDPCMMGSDSTYLQLEEYPVVGIIADTTICFSDSILEVYASGANNYQWLPASEYNNPNSDRTLTSIPSSDSVKVQISFDICPDTTLGSFITVNEPLQDLQPIADKEVCEGDAVSFTATADPSDNIVWVNPNGDTLNNPLNIASAQSTDQGTYKAIAYLGANNYCVFDSLEVDLNIRPNIILSASATPQTACPGESITVSVTGSTMVEWRNESGDLINTKTSFDSVFTTSQRLYVNASDPTACNGLDSVDIVVRPDFTVDLGPDLNRCQGDDVTISVNVGDFYAAPSSIVWNTGETTESITVSQAGIYWAEVNINGCVHRDSVELFIQDPGNFTLGNDTTLCEGDSLIIDLSGFSGDITWNDGDKSSVRTFKYPGGSFSVDIQSGLCQLSDDININFDDSSSVTLPNDTLVCEGEVLTYTGESTGSNVWVVNGEDSVQNSITLSEPGVYNITLNNSQGVCTASDELVAEIQAKPEGALPETFTICTGDSVLVDATISGGTNYQWTDGNSKASRYLSQAGKYFVTIDAGACSITDSTEVIEQTLPMPNLGPDRNFCDTALVTLNNNTSGTSIVNWYLDGVLISNDPNSITVSQTGEYVLEIGEGSCTASDTVLIEILEYPVFDLGPDTSLCSQQVLNLNTGYPNFSNVWQDGTTSNAYTISTTGQYFVEVSNGQCSASDTINVDYIVVQIPDLGNDTAICIGESIVLDSKTTAFDSIRWSNGSSTDNITVNTTGNYFVDVFFGQCKTTDTINVQVDQIPVFSLGNDTALCPQQTLALNTGFPNNPTIWQDGSSNPTFTVNTAGIYWAEVQNGACSFRDSIQVDYINVQVPNLGPDQTFCEGDSTTLSSNTTGADSILWNTGSTDPTIKVYNAGTYFVDVFFGQCKTSDTIQIQTDEFPVFDLGNDTTLCPQQTLNLTTGYPNYFNFWSDNTVTADNSLSTAGTYFVDVVNGTCTASDTITLDYMNVQIPDLGPDANFCEDQSIVLNSKTSGYDNIQWSNFSTTDEITVNSSGTYFVDVTFGACTTSDTIDVLVDQIPSFNLGNDTTLCPQQSINLNTGFANNPNIWQDGTSTSTYNVTTSGIYWAEVTNGTCVFRDSIVVNYENIQVPNIGADTALCQGQSITLSSNITAFDSILWSNGSSNNTITVSIQDKYFVDVFYSQCKVSDTIILNVLQVPTFDLGPDITACENARVAIGNDLPFPHQWNTGSTNDSIFPTQDGNYELTLNNLHCEFTDDVNVAFVPAPIVDLGPDVLACTGDSTILNGPSGNYTYTWNNVVENQQKTIKTTGQYVLSVSDGFCTVNDTMDAEFTIPTDPNLPAGFLCAPDSILLDASIANGINYTWNTGETSSSIYATDSGTYFVDIEEGGCLTRYTTEVNISERPNLDLGADVDVCVQESTVLNTNLPNLSTQWSTGETSQSIKVSQAGVYKVSVQNGACTISDSVEVFYHPLPQLSVLDYEVCPNDSLLLNLTDIATNAVWNDGFIGTQRYLYSGEVYGINLISAFGCQNSFEIAVFEQDDCLDEVYVPSAFTPDGDGLNEIFIPVLPRLQMLNLSIYNRWGERIFYTEDQSVGWDGTYKQEKAKGDVYAWRMQYIDSYGVKQQAFGKVTLVR